MVKGEVTLSQTSNARTRERLRLGGWAGGALVLASHAESGSLLRARTGSVTSDQLVEKGERHLIRFVVRWCSHDRLAEHLRQTTLFKRWKGAKRVKRNQIGP